MASTITQYPYYVKFFSTAEKLALGGMPFLVGDDKPSRLYVSNKRKLAGEAGMQSKHVELPNDASQAQVEDAVAAVVG